MSTVSGSASNASPPPRSVAGPQHTRTYQACIPCRRRKVRCDLGPVDNPHDPPCVRCRRESKECFFSATRRKRKTSDGEEDALDEADDYELRNGRKRVRSGPPENFRPSPVAVHRGSSAAYVSQPLTPGGSIGRYEPLRRPTASLNPHGQEEDQTVNNATAAILQTGEVYSGHDALNLLFEAAGRNGDIEGHHHRNVSSGSSHAHMYGPGSTPGSQQFTSPQANTHSFDPRMHSRMPADHPVDPNLSQHRSAVPPPPNAQSFADAVKAWSRFRFVRAGWLTAKEAITYIDYFYTYLSPLTPIVVPDYRDHALHGKLLSEEPMLVITLLTISSRFALPDSFGGQSRGPLIHEKFWNYLKGMINRMIYGQEQFGGGFCGAGQQPGSDVNPLSRKGLRTLGSVESLMLLTEWHPRALHFPPGDDEDELVIPDDPIESIEGLDARDDLIKAVGGQRIDSWLEPCWRSDRMCWMLLGNAMALAFEIGVFDETSEAEFEEANQHLSHATVKAYFRRKGHLRDLLIIYVTQTSGRLGLSSMLPKLEREEDERFRKTPSQMYKERISQIRPPPPNLGSRPDGQRLPFESVATQNKHAVQDLVLDFWSRIATIMEMGNHKLFPNRRQTRDLLKSGEYENTLKAFQEPLQQWRNCFKAATEVPRQLRAVLTIEYEYTRVYINSLALQAVVERCTHNTPPQQYVQPDGPGYSNPQDGGAIPFSTINKWYGADRHYISEVIDAARNVLRVVVDDLWPGDYLRHAPVRTFFRIVSVAIILLKTFALGSTQNDVEESLNILARGVEALRHSIVDDVHVGNRFADLVETLTQRIKSRFVRLQANGPTGVSRAESTSPTRNGMPPDAMGPPPQPPNYVHPHGLPGGYPNTSASIPGSPSIAGMNNSGRGTPNQTMWGINPEPYDPAQSFIMPPQNYNEYLTPQYSMNEFERSEYPQDWLALPLNPLIGQNQADITQTPMGPDVGGFDMLDVLLMEPPSTT